MTALAHRQLKLGRLVSQREIAEITESSLSSVREALKWLEAQGIVQLKPKRGVEFREVSRKEVAESYDFRKLIELAAIEKFVESHSLDLVHELRSETLILIEEQNNSSLKTGHLARRVRIDNQLHRVIVSSLNNELISGAHKRNETIMLLARLNLPPAYHEAGPALLEHIDLLDKVLARDSRGARQKLKEHLDLAQMRATQSLVE